MQTRDSTRSADRHHRTKIVPWAWLERHIGTAFTLAGGFLLASALVPLALKPVTNLAWVSGLVLVGLGFLALAGGISGLYPTPSSRHSRLATLGVLGSFVAGVAALGVIGMAVTALIGEGVLGMDLGKPVGIFGVVALAMVGGIALGELSAGTAGFRSEAISRTTSLLLLVGGGVLTVPVVAEVLRWGFGIETGIPQWIFLPALALIILDSLALGQTVRSEA